jgi:hypothetical protein
LLHIIPPVSFEDHIVVGLCGQDFAVLATYSGKPDTLTIPLCEMTSAHWVWEMVRVACTYLVNPSRNAIGGGVLCS